MKRNTHRMRFPFRTILLLMFTLIGVRSFRVTNDPEHSVKIEVEFEPRVGFEDLIKPFEAEPKSKTAQTGKSAGIYRIRKSWKNAASQIGAYRDYQLAVQNCLPGYSVFSENGTVLYTA